jgi:K+/H+ antiporter YhaU regulatory subunit KhtT
MVDFVEMAHSGVDLEMDRFLVGKSSSLIGKTLAELELPRRAGAHVVAVHHADGKTNYRPDHRLKLAEGDNLILVGRVGVAEAVEQIRAED